MTIMRVQNQYICEYPDVPDEKAVASTSCLGAINEAPDPFEALFMNLSQILVISDRPKHLSHSETF